MAFSWDSVASGRAREILPNSFDDSFTKPLPDPYLGSEYRQKISSNQTVRLQRAAQDLKNRAKIARVEGWHAVAIQTAEQEAGRAIAAWENSFQSDAQLDVSTKKAHAQDLKDTLQQLRQNGKAGPHALAAAEKEANEARTTWEKAVQEAETRRRDFANPQLSGAARIDLEHLRPSTRYDQLTEALQRDLDAADEAILMQMKHCEEMEVTLIPKVKQTGELIPAEIDLIARKLETVQDGFGLDAEEEQYLEKWVVRKDAGEVRLVGRNVERVKAPTHYQLGPGSTVGADGVPGTDAQHGLFNGGLSGWWNNPQTLRGGMRGGSSAKGVQISLDDTHDTEEYVDPSVKPPPSLADLFDRRTAEMRDTLDDNKKVLAEIETYVGGVEDKVRGRERELIERQDYGYYNGDSPQKDAATEKARQRRLLNLAFEEAHRSLYEVAGRVSTLREGLMKVSSAG